MLLDNVRPDPDDRLYFLYRFAIRSWLFFLAVLFSAPIMAIRGRSFTGKQFLALWVVFGVIVIVDFISIWIKAHPIYKEQDRVEWENWGRKKTR